MPPETSGTPSGIREAHFISKTITWTVVICAPPLVASWLSSADTFFDSFLSWLPVGLGLLIAILVDPLRKMVAGLANWAERIVCGLAMLLTSLIRQVGKKHLIRILVVLMLPAAAALAYYVWVSNLPVPDFDFGECVLISLPADGGGEVLQVSLATAHPELYSVRLTSRYWQDDEERLHGRTRSSAHGYALVSLRKRDDHQGEAYDSQIEIRRHWKVAWVSLSDITVRQDALRYVIDRGEAERLSSHPRTAGREGA